MWEARVTFQHAVRERSFPQHSGTAKPAKLDISLTDQFLVPSIRY